MRTKKYTEAVRFLVHISELLAQAGESSSASDLILYLIEVFKKAGYTSDPETRGQLVQLVSYLNAGKEPLVKKIAKEALDWSKTSTTPFGDPELHHVFGAKFAQESADTYEAERHLLLGTKDSPKLLAVLLYNWAVQPGSPSDKVSKTSALEAPVASNVQNSNDKTSSSSAAPATLGGSSSDTITIYKESLEEKVSNLPLYLSRGVFGYLSIGNIRDARALVQEFIRLALNDTTTSPSLTPFLDYEMLNSEAGSQIFVFSKVPLLNFVQLLIPTCQLKSAQMYQRLKSRYDEIIKEISAWDEALGVIGKNYFGLQPPRNQGNMLQDLFGSIMGGMN